MTSHLTYTLVDGIKCYSKDVALDYSNYPDSGFDLTDTNADSSFWVSSRNRLFKSILQRLIRPEGKTKLLEIGCGTGDLIRKIYQNPALEITGSEIYLKGLLYAKKNLPNVEFIQFDVTQGSIGGSFDIIAAFDVIEHIGDDELAIANIFEMLKKDGIFVVSVPQHMFLWSRLDELVKHKRRYSKKELIGKLSNSGFEVTYSTSFVFSLFPLMLASRILDRKSKDEKSVDQLLEDRVQFHPLLNILFDFIMRIDEFLIGHGFSLPFGGTLVAIAVKH